MLCLPWQIPHPSGDPQHEDCIPQEQLSLRTSSRREIFIVGFVQKTFQHFHLDHGKHWVGFGRSRNSRRQWWQGAWVRCPWTVASSSAIFLFCSLITSARIFIFTSALPISSLYFSSHFSRMLSTNSWNIVPAPRAAFSFQFWTWAPCCFPMRLETFMEVIALSFACCPRMVDRWSLFYWLGTSRELWDFKRNFAHFFISGNSDALKSFYSSHCILGKLWSLQVSSSRWDMAAAYNSRNAYAFNLIDEQI